MGNPAKEALCDTTPRSFSLLDIGFLSSLGTLGVGTPTKEALLWTTPRSFSLLGVGILIPFTCYSSLGGGIPAKETLFDPMSKRFSFLSVGVLGSYLSGQFSFRGLFFGFCRAPSLIISGFLRFLWNLQMTYLLIFLTFRALTRLLSPWFENVNSFMVIGYHQPFNL